MQITIPYPFELLTERLAIRSPEIDAATQLREAIAETIGALKPWMPWAQQVPTLAEAEENCAKAAKAFKEGTDYRLHLFLRDSGLFVGGSGLHRVDWSIPKLEIGYWIRQSCTGRGLVTEAVAEITRYAFETLGTKRVEIRASALNTRSCRIPPRLGFTLEGVLHNNERLTDGTLSDTHVYAKIEP